LDATGFLGRSRWFPCTPMRRVSRQGIGVEAGLAEAHVHTHRFHRLLIGRGKSELARLEKTRGRAARSDRIDSYAPAHGDWRHFNGRVPRAHQTRHWPPFDGSNVRDGPTHTSFDFSSRSPSGRRQRTPPISSPSPAGLHRRRGLSATFSPAGDTHAMRMLWPRAVRPGRRSEVRELLVENCNFGINAERAGASIDSSNLPICVDTSDR